MDNYFKEKIEEKKKIRLINFNNDLDRMARRHDCFCRECFYLKKDMVAMDVITYSNCSVCGKEMVFPSSSVNIVCDFCANRFSLCKKCGKELD